MTMKTNMIMFSIVRFPDPRISKPLFDDHDGHKHNGDHDNDNVDDNDDAYLQLCCWPWTRRPRQGRRPRSQADSQAWCLNDDNDYYFDDDDDDDDHHDDDE